MMFLWNKKKMFQKFLPNPSDCPWNLDLGRLTCLSKEQYCKHIFSAIFFNQHMLTNAVTCCDFYPTLKPHPHFLSFGYTFSAFVTLCKLWAHFLNFWHAFSYFLSLLPQNIGSRLQMFYAAVKKPFWHRD